MVVVYWHKRKMRDMTQGAKHSRKGCGLLTKEERTTTDKRKSEVLVGCNSGFFIVQQVNVRCFVRLQLGLL